MRATYRAGLATALLLIPALLTLGPAATADPGHALPRTYVVGLVGMPSGAPGTFLGEPVLSADPELRQLVVEARSPAFEQRALTHADVRYVEEVTAEVQTLLTPNDPYFGAYQYDLRAGTTNIVAAWDTTVGTAAVKVCVLDTGIHRGHEDFSGLSFGGFADFVNGRTSPYDDNGHGTHVSGTLAAVANNGKGIAGVAQATLYVAKVLDRQGAGTWTQVASGIKWCADQGVHIISMSLGGGASSVLADAVAYADAAGVLQVAAAGNSGPCTSCVTYPAALAAVVAVSCTDQGNALCGFSSQGPQVDLAAPGQDIVSLWAKGVRPCRKHHGDACYVRTSGTSMSAPHVSGLAALVKSAHPADTKDDLYNAMKASAWDLGAPGFDPRYGWGLIRGSAVLA